MVTKVLTIEEEIELVRLEERLEGREEGKALTVIEMLADGDISYDKAKQKLDKLRVVSPNADYWVNICKSLNEHNPNPSVVNEPSVKYKTKP